MARRKRSLEPKRTRGLYKGQYIRYLSCGCCYVRDWREKHKLALAMKEIKDGNN